MHALVVSQIAMRTRINYSLSCSARLVGAEGVVPRQFTARLDSNMQSRMFTSLAGRGSVQLPLLSENRLLTLCVSAVIVWL